ncbi:MAG: glycine cleavage system protein H [Candidatus Marinimicrobia bacterium]|jgi:glycine cleavage system H protein|nr:glycine cleavage system protein H [Candidatus Neomarinimicrobiota bacterium]MEC7622346.1 glycine cleavage system protein GcvH [Candidatus Neomarinimicrobiota bacterium]MEC7901348.1 glycine cleavage system protein GcvH [Candidatus Neomarinimicrobiota bacterium]|tara:strand:- start:284 stop:661 length:378 start_codon:yes stop_codon:yes gene_type:complete
MNTPNDIKYTKEHEWVSLDGETATIGITDYAQSQLGDIVFVEFPDINSEINQNETFGVIEAVKTVADLFAPVSGEIIEVNSSLEDSPNFINSDPYGSGWIIKIKINDSNEYNGLMSSDDYEEHIQ